ncbi:MAG: cyclodeaminase/cyclohydrolase family protein [Lachnospiraceae bacterium]|nr:cyclodeaminase/cyclohydrolase family protein [Lachnospiraceae bacterium]
MKMIEKTVTAFTEELASPAPVPGGGGASALAGAIGISLGDMVGELTTGKKKYADVEEDIQALMKRAQALRVKLLGFVDGDAEAFAPLAKAYGIPKDDPTRGAVMESALQVACSVPMDILRTCADAIDIIGEFAAKGSRLAVSDAGCGAILCKAAMQAASLNIYINTKSMKDRALAQALEAEADALLSGYTQKADDIFNSVMAGIRS